MVEAYFQRVDFRERYIRGLEISDPFWQAMATLATYLLDHLDTLDQMLADNSVNPGTFERHIFQILSLNPENDSDCCECQNLFFNYSCTFSPLEFFDRFLKNTLSPTEFHCYAIGQTDEETYKSYYQRFSETYPSLIKEFAGDDGVDGVDVDVCQIFWNLFWNAHHHSNGGVLYEFPIETARELLRLFPSQYELKRFAPVSPNSRKPPSKRKFVNRVRGSRRQPWRNCRSKLKTRNYK